jgi:ligand-binding sensor domain-containing protein
VRGIPHVRWILGAFALTAVNARAEYAFEQHLFGNEVRSMVAHEGSLYWATSSGLVRMNLADTTFVVHRRRDRGLPSDSLHTLAFDGAGNLWCGSESGVAVLGPTGRWERLTTFDGLPHPRARSIERAGGEMLIGTSSGYVTIRDVESKEVTASCTVLDPCVDAFPSLDILTTFRRSPSEQWYGTNAGPVRVRTGPSGTETTALGEGLSNPQVFAFTEGAGAFWVGTTSGAYRLDVALDEWLPTVGLVDAAGGPGDARSFLLVGSRLLCASSSAARVFEWDGASWSQVGSNFSGAARPRVLVLDENGVTWCGTTGGLRALNATGTSWSTNVIRVPGLTSGASIWSVATGSRPETWIGYQGASESAVLRDGAWLPITSQSTGSGYEPRPTQALLVDRSGAVWFGHCCCSGSTGCLTDRAEGADASDLDWMRVPARNVRSIAQNGLGHTFLGSGAEDPAVSGVGLYFWRSSFGADSVAIIPPGGAILEGRITGLAFASDGALWLGYRERGVHRWNYGVSPLDDPVTDQSVYFDVDDRSLISDEVLSMAADGNRIWVGTTRGVSLFVGGEHNADFGSFYFDNPVVTALAVTSDHSLWAGTPTGLVRLVPNALGTYDTETYAFPQLSNDRINGLAARGAEVWVATSRGVVVGTPVSEGEPPNALARGAVYPNPFRVTALDGIRLADVSVAVDVDIYDATGAPVASSRNVSPGAVVWDGLVDGVVATPGLYVVVARADDLTLKTRVAVLR